MRLFVAINLNDDIKDALVDIQNTIRTCGIRGKETSPENMHMTLAFIGEFNDPDLVKEVVDSIDIRPFQIKISGVGTFRDLWWVGAESNETLFAISRKLRRALADADIPFDRKKFSPHITIIRRGKGKLSEVPEKELESAFGASMTADHISLMRSDRGKYGIIYTEL